MSDSSDRERARWDERAPEWASFIGEDGDRNRRFNSDPVLWRLLGDVSGKTVLDAGCGAGYLGVLLARRGAHVTAVDWSREMIRLTSGLARRRRVEIDARVDSCSELATIADASIDLVVSNYVLMDVPDLDGASAAMARVLRPGGAAVVVINHPCFSAPSGPERLEDGSVRYRWTFSYFEDTDYEQTWGTFRAPFVVHHRPLGRYWSSFAAAGLSVSTLEEPVVPTPPPEGCEESVARRYRMTPYSLAMRLRRDT